MTRGHIGVKRPGQVGRANRFVFLFVVIVCLVTPLLPIPAIGSEGEVVITTSVFLNPLEVQASAPSEVTLGTIFTLEAIIRNNGDLRMRKVTAAIYLPKDLELVKSKVESKRGIIVAHKDITVCWKVRALKEGNHIIMVLATGTYGGKVITEQDVVLVAVK